MLEICQAQGMFPGAQGPPREGYLPIAATAKPPGFSQLGFAMVSWGWGQIPTFFVLPHIPEQLGGDGHRLRLAIRPTP